MPSGPDGYRLGNLTIVFYVESVPLSPPVIRGETSLGGSESACLGLAKALARRGHDVHIFAAKLDLGDPTSPDYRMEFDGVQWHSSAELPEVLKFSPPDVFCSLRMIAPFQMYVTGGLNLLWAQDLLGEVTQVAAALPQVDSLVFVSQFHREQWQEVDPLLAKVPAFVTRNSFDPSCLPAPDSGIVRHPYRFCHISRPERGLGVLLQMWPQIKALWPHSELHIARYDSMYDARGWGVVCAEYDRECQRLAEEVGGIKLHGNLNKRDLYALMSSCNLMLYPGVSDFAETGCLAAVEAQATGAIPLCSYKGSLPEVIPEGCGILVEGASETKDYQDRYIQALADLLRLRPHERNVIRQKGLDHVLPGFTFDQQAQDWEEWLLDTFHHRYRTQKLGVLRQLMHWDQHVAAQMVAQEIIDDLALAAGPVPVEATESLALCHRVITQEEQTAEHYAAFSMDTLQEAKDSTRLHRVVERLKASGCKTLLDVACGNGSLTLIALSAIPDLRVEGWDYSAGVIEKAQKAIQEAGYAHRATFHVGAWDEIHGQFDAVFCGEFLEHVERPELVVDRLESCCKPGGTIIITTPIGPISELIARQIPLRRGHTHSYSNRDITTLMQHKIGQGLGEHGTSPRRVDPLNPAVDTEVMWIGQSPQGRWIGYWIVQWGPGGGPAQPLDYWHTILTTRPYQRRVATLIVKDASDWLHRCLASVWKVVDDIVVLDTGSADGGETKQIVARFPNAHFILHDHLDPPLAWPECGFAEARNTVLDIALDHYDPDWILWIDADEHLDGGHHILRYTCGQGPFLGYVLRQHHLMLDADRFYDVPVRLFRAKADPPIRFYGLVHEQPETELNAGIVPSLDCPDINVVHYGYETEEIRKQKLTTRNLELLRREIAMGSTREIDYVILVRELVTLAGWAGIADSRRRNDPELELARTYLQRAIKMYRQRGYDDPAHKMHGLIFPSYQLALKWLGVGCEVEWGFGMGRPRLKGQIKTEKMFVATPEEAHRIMDYRTKEWLKQMATASYRTTPYSGARPPDVPESHPERDLSGLREVLREG